MPQLGFPLAGPLGGDLAGPDSAVSGSDISVAVNPVTGKLDFVWDAGSDLQWDDTRAHAIVSLVVERRGLWWADATRKRGSRLLDAKVLLQRTASEVKADLEQALKPLLTSGAIFKPDRLPLVDASVSGSRLKIIVNWGVPRLGQQALNLEIADGRVQVVTTISGSIPGIVGAGGGGGFS